MPKLGWIDLLDILFVAFLVYQILVWFRMKRAWTLFKGVVLLVVVALAASMLRMNMTSWLLQNTMVYGVLALVIIFQPEIRRALERLGHGGLFSILSSDEGGDKVSKETVKQIADAMEQMAAVKTGALIEASMLIGAVLGGAAEEDCKIVESLAAKIGMAFQIQDDILDVTGSQDVTGKPSGSDEKNKKTTYVTLEGLDKAKKDVEQISTEAIEELNKLPGNNDFLEQLIRALVGRQK